MNAVASWMEQGKAFEFELPDGTPVIRLGLIVTLYFKEGYTAAKKRAVVNCFERFYDEFASVLKSQVYERSKKLTRTTFDASRDKLLSSTPNSQYEWCVSSATGVTDVGETSLFAMNTFELHGDKIRSVIKLTLPWSLLAEANGAARFLQWLGFLCESIEPEHGYAGPSILQPYDRPGYLEIETTLAQQFLGVEPDNEAGGLTRQLLGCVKGMNWCTVLSTALVEQLGGAQQLQASLVDAPEVNLLPFNAGLILQAGDLPALIPAGSEIPQAYTVVNALIRPIRCADIDAILCTQGTPFFDRQVTRRWQTRLDLDRPEPAPLTRVGGHQPCPQTGDWQRWECTDIRHHFVEGELMPVLDGDTPSQTLWYWSAECAR
ncbi:type VI immunity family protein [Pseudomonas purpurea]|uniref:type VI immunity family protein n=1 Tax=Pseudomonas purpurea TaxID=3136737 RepID=UPI003263B52C